MKRTIKLTESELRRMISESVRRVLNEDKPYDYMKNDKEFRDKVINAIKRIHNGENPIDVYDDGDWYFSRNGRERSGTRVKLSDKMNYVNMYGEPIYMWADWYSPYHDEDGFLKFEINGKYYFLNIHDSKNILSFDEYNEYKRGEELKQSKPYINNTYKTDRQKKAEVKKLQNKNFGNKTIFKGNL
jgi:hypothetical protein